MHHTEGAFLDSTPERAGEQSAAWIARADSTTARVAHCHIRPNRSGLSVRSLTYDAQLEGTNAEESPAALTGSTRIMRRQATSVRPFFIGGA
jgi:hypothetical protein